VLQFELPRAAALLEVRFQQSPIGFPFPSAARHVKCDTQADQRCVHPIGQEMTNSAKTVAIFAIAAAVLVTLVIVIRDILLRQPRTVHCPDGSHPTIDIRDFTTQYWAYSVKLEANVTDTAKVSAELDPQELEQLSEALQRAREFRKYIVAGYNSCAITQSQYAQFGARFNALDALAREINTLISKSPLSQGENTKVARLIGQYLDLARQLGSQ
jgi:hypothetical protein